MGHFQSTGPRLRGGKINGNLTQLLWRPAGHQEKELGDFADSGQTRRMVFGIVGW